MRECGIRAILVAIFRRPVTDISATAALIDVILCMMVMVHIAPGHSLPFCGQDPREPQTLNFGPEFWPLNRKYLENGNSQSLTSARQNLPKCIACGGNFLGATHIRRNMLHF